MTEHPRLTRPDAARPGDADSAQTILVTGGASGIGLATVERFRRAGHRAFAVDQVAPEDGSAGVDFRQADVTDSAALTQVVDDIARETGRLDAIVACAGINRDAVFWKLTDDDWRRVIEVNLDGAFYLLRAALRHFRARGQGAAVLVGSINGERGWFGQANYSASKAGVFALARTAAREVGRFGVRVNAVSPGYIDTPMTAPLPADIVRQASEASPLGRIGSADEVASVIAFLCSADASYVTGSVIRVDGGQVC